ncbi:hypothetical protein EV360DRAFT_77503 [Lentinula raphanica]|nr:hypothetical protein EV360DRAFT_77503 [Lentinula raphanica]
MLDCDAPSNILNTKPPSERSGPTPSIPYPRPSRPSRTRSLPSRIHSTSRALASISEEHGDVPIAPTAQLRLQWSSSDLGRSRHIANAKNRGKLRIRTNNAFNDRDCGICFDPAVRPSRTKCCGKLFCEEHLHDWLNGSSNRCPDCASNCNPVTDTISLAPPMTPTIHNSPTGTPPLPRTPPTPPSPLSFSLPTWQLVQTPAPAGIHSPRSLGPLLIRSSSTSTQASSFSALIPTDAPMVAKFLTSEPNSGSHQSQLPIGPPINDEGAEGATKIDPLSQNPTKNSTSSTPRAMHRSGTLLPLLNAVSNALTHKVARGLLRRDTNDDAPYDSSTENSLSNPITDNFPHESTSLLPSPNTFPEFSWSPSWPETPTWSKYPYLSTILYLESLLRSFFGFEFDPGWSHDTVPANLPLDQDPTSIVGTEFRNCFSSSISVYSEYASNTWDISPQTRDSEESKNVGRNMFVRVLGMVGMVLVLHALFLGRY